MPAATCQRSGQSDVAVDGEVVEQVAGLEQHADQIGSQSRPLTLSSAGHLSIAHNNRSAVRFVETTQTGEQGRLPGAGRTEHGNDLAGLDPNGNAGEGDHFFVTVVEEAVEAVCSQDRCHDHANESVTVRHGSTLSALTGPDSVTMASMPVFQNS